MSSIGTICGTGVLTLAEGRDQEGGRQKVRGQRSEGQKKKLQIPSFKLQRSSNLKSSKSQVPEQRTRLYWRRTCSLQVPSAQPVRLGVTRQHQTKNAKVQALRRSG